MHFSRVGPHLRARSTNYKKDVTSPRCHERALHAGRQSPEGTRVGFARGCAGVHEATTKVSSRDDQRVRLTTAQRPEAASGISESFNQRRRNLMPATK